MDKLIFKTIKSEHETLLVLDKIERYSGVRLPEEYVKKSKIVGAFLHNQLAACYLLVTRPGFRSLTFVPDSALASSDIANLDSYEMMEINGLWIGPSLKKPSLQIKVWMHLAFDVFSSRKKYVLLMRDFRTKTMKKFMDMTNPTSIYEGNPQLMAGEKTHKQIQVSYTTRWNFVVNIYKCILELWNRQRRANAFNKEQNLVRSLKNSEANYI